MPATDLEYALFAAHAYQTTRQPINRVPEPMGWGRLVDTALDTRLQSIGFAGQAWHVTSGSGFEAVAYLRGNEVVISFAGTGPLPGADGRVDWITNGGLALGGYDAQLRDAALYYVALKEALPAATSFSFTGHSLGGGLASLMGVYFNKTAVTFDQAPFREAAVRNFRDRLAGDLTANGLSPDADLAAYVVGPGGPRGENLVRSITLEGEALSVLPVVRQFSRIGAQLPPIDLDNAVVSAMSSIAKASSPVDLGFKAVVTLNSQQLTARGQPFVLNPGMQVIAEIRQGERTVMEYLLSPVTATVTQAGRER